MKRIKHTVTHTSFLSCSVTGALSRWMASHRFNAMVRQAKEQERIVAASFPDRIAKLKIPPLVWLAHKGDPTSMLLSTRDLETLNPGWTVNVHNETDMTAFMRAHFNGEPYASRMQMTRLCSYCPYLSVHVCLCTRDGPSQGIRPHQSADYGRPN